MYAAKQIRQLAVACAIVSVPALAIGSPAFGKGCPGNLTNEGPSAVQQYVETLPTSCGSHATGIGARKTKLPRSIARKIHAQGGPDASLLTKIATSESFGAPQQRIKVRSKRTKHLGIANKHLGKVSARGRNPFSASVTVLTDGSDSRLIALVVLMLSITAVALGTAVRRRRANR